MENIIERLNRIDQIVASADTSQTDFILSVLGGQAERVYLFNRASASFSKKFFVYLAQLNAFDFARIPGPKTEEGEDGKENKWFYGWDAGFLLRAAAEQNQAVGDPDVNNIVITLINNYIDYVFARREDPNRNFRPDWFFCDCIEFLPLQDIQPAHIRFIKEIGFKGPMSHVAMDLTTKFFKRLVKAKHVPLMIELLELLYKEDTERKEMFFDLHGQVDNYTLREFSSNSAPGLVEVLGTHVIDWLNNRIEVLARAYPTAFLKFTIVSIDEDNQNRHSEELNHLILKQLRNCLNVTNAFNSKQLEGYAKTYLSHSIPVLQRMGIYLINQNFLELQHLFWQIDNPMKENEWKLEVHKLLLAHGPELNESQVAQLKDWIEKTEHEKIEGQTAEQEDQYNAYRKLERYAALETINDDLRPLIDSKIEELKAKTNGTMPTHPGYDSWFEMRAGGDHGRKRLSEESIQQVSTRLSNPDKWDGYDQWGLQEDFRNLITSKPQEVVKNIDVFFTIPVTFLYYLFDGFRNAIGSKSEIDWSIVLNFILLLFEKRDDLWNNDNPQAQDNQITIGMIAWLIKDGTDKSIFNEHQLNDLCVQVLVIADERYTRPFVYLNDKRNPNFDIINSTRGKLYNAMIRVSIAIANKKDSAEQKWHLSIKSVFEKRLLDNSYLDEFYWTLGFFTPQLSYLDKSWWFDNREKIYLYNNQIDDFAFKGYLLYTGRVYKDIYEGLLLNYFRALDLYEEKSIYTDRLVEHVLIAWEAGLPEGEDLLDSLLKKKNIGWLGHLVNYIDRRNIIISENKLLVIWRRLIETCATMKDKKAGSVIFNTADFIDNIDHLSDEIVDLFRTVVNHYTMSPMVHRIAESLTNFIDQDPVRAGTMLQMLLEKTQGDFSYGNSKILDGLQKLYKNDQITLADKIALHLAEEGNFYVKDIYNQFH